MSQKSSLPQVIQSVSEALMPDTGPKSEQRTIYSLRHTCFMFRLMYGEKIDTLTLARNGRTSVEMVEKHYASQLRGEHNIDMIQSRRKRHQKRDRKETEAQ